MKKYFAWSYPDIRAIEIAKETESYVYIAYSDGSGSRREAKRTEDRGYFDTWSEARDFLIYAEESKIATLTRELARRHENVRKIQEMLG